MGTVMTLPLPLQRPLRLLAVVVRYLRAQLVCGWREARRKRAGWIVAARVQRRGQAVYARECFTILAPGPEGAQSGVAAELRRDQNVTDYVITEAWPLAGHARTV